MRRALLLLATAIALAVPASASAAVTPNQNAGEVAAALSAPGAAAAETGTIFDTLPPNGNPAAISTGALGGFPTDGSTFAVLSSGDATHADPANPEGENDNGGAPAAGGPRPSVYDLATLRVDFTVPATANCAVFSFRFATDEQPANGSFNDGFIAELGPSNWTENAGNISAPNNFAFDTGGNVISVNSPGSTGLTPEQATGTGFASATARLTAATPIAPGTRQSVYLSIFDQGDAVLDSAVLLDGLDLQQRPAAECVRGAQDEIAPAVTLTTPANGSSSTDDTPTFAGAAGEAAGDAGTVGVEVRFAGTLVETLAAPRAGTAWSVDSAPLGPGDYSVRATQLDAAGNTGVSETRTFTVLAQPPPPDEPDVPDLPDVEPVPVLGKSVAVGVVSGTVRIKLKNGKFRTLRADEAIPLGSTIDATKGRVQLTSAAGKGKTQTGDFYQGVFVVTQTRGAKPITQLALSGKLTCAKKKRKGKKATTSAKKRVRRLWGDGKGRFRTKGKHGAATVRGTKWLTEDRCGSTKVTVKRGTVVVRDFTKKKNHIVKKGHSYVARG